MRPINKNMDSKKLEHIKCVFLAFSISSLALYRYLEFTDSKVEEMTDFCEKTLKNFVNNVLGFEVSPMCGRGLHGYQNSMILHANSVDVGFIGLGGQRDTIYFEISANGCKSLFNHTTPLVICECLSKVLGVTNLTRIGLAFDDFDEKFDCDHAVKSYRDGHFRRVNHGCAPFISSNKIYDADSNELCTQSVFVGSPRSAVYWRIYNKKLEQGIEQKSLSWCRSEVILKKWTVDALLDVAATFSDICTFAGAIGLDNNNQQLDLQEAI